MLGRVVSHALHMKYALPNDYVNEILSFSFCSMAMKYLVGGTFCLQSASGKHQGTTDVGLCFRKRPHHTYDAPLVFL